MKLAQGRCGWAERREKNFSRVIFHRNFKMKAKH